MTIAYFLVRKVITLAGLERRPGDVQIQCDQMIEKKLAFFSKKWFEKWPLQFFL